jgi:hypothetical protein
MKWVMLAAALASVLLGASPSPAAADSNVQLETGSVEINALVQGCDEYIHFTGTLRFLNMRVSSAADTGFSDVHIVENVVGVGETSGTTYRVLWVMGERWVAAGAVGGSNEVTFKILGGQFSTFKLVGHWTRTPNGDITVSFGEEVIKEWGCSA